MDIQEFRDKLNYILENDYDKIDNEIQEFVENSSMEEFSMIAMEECSEMIQAISKLNRFKNHNPNVGGGNYTDINEEMEKINEQNNLKFHLLEEMADVFICIKGLLCKTKFDFTDDFIPAVMVKTNRLKDKINKTKLDTNREIKRGMILFNRHERDYYFINSIDLFNPNTCEDTVETFHFNNKGTFKNFKYFSIDKLNIIENEHFVFNEVCNYNNEKFKPFSLKQELPRYILPVFQRIYNFVKDYINNNNLIEFNKVYIREDESKGVPLYLIPTQYKTTTSPIYHTSVVCKPFYKLFKTLFSGEEIEFDPVIFYVKCLPTEKWREESEEIVKYIESTINNSVNKIKNDDLLPFQPEPGMLVNDKINDKYYFIVDKNNIFTYSITGMIGLSKEKINEKFWKNKLAKYIESYNLDDIIKNKIPDKFNTMISLLREEIRKELEKKTKNLWKYKNCSDNFIIRNINTDTVCAIVVKIDEKQVDVFCPMNVDLLDFYINSIIVKSLYIEDEKVSNKLKELFND